ncbi:hypothetical protein EV426DRAFT_710964 [Tirmania nivea]|nr:hypothetical protein EV426DRAFT_710964 [Tirmania nivea]
MVVEEIEDSFTMGKEGGLLGFEDRCGQPTDDIFCWGGVVAVMGYRIKRVAEFFEVRKAVDLENEVLKRRVELMKKENELLCDILRDMGLRLRKAEKLVEAVSKRKMMFKLLFQAGRAVRISCPATVRPFIEKALRTRSTVLSVRNFGESGGNQVLKNETFEATSVSRIKDRFFEVEKVGFYFTREVTVGRHHGDIKDLSGEVKDLNKKINSMFVRLVLLMAGGVIAEGAFDSYRDERAWRRTSQVKGYN